ncbi:carbohydrate ABC transporter permease [Occultella aeris]|uniref:sn-glycerol-3-phosphate transport system permease protein UgpA n=1 Tax=Occultella aeris TaxID=2761496 RepID=A0A7M4DS66_9MICO|nr:sugar ABC transporter permease [Occultella aeris]VZO40310.1 sn-glycerol-3-phosphate transport system permease protein UgpA [Occultella aeris]
MAATTQTPEVATATPPRRRLASIRRGQTIAPLIFIAAAVVLFALFFVWPGALGLWYSFTDYRGVGDPEFIGVENYAALFQDATFYSVLGRTAFYTLLSVPLHFVISLGIAVLVTTRNAKGKVPARVVFFMPWLISPIVNGVIWRWLFGENFGFVNYLLSLVGVDAVPWQTDANLSLAVVLFASSWGGTAFNMLLFMAALKNIPRSYLEAAEIDGATGWQRFRHITLPLLAPTSFLVVLLTTIGSMKEFAMIQALNGGGPGTENMLMVQYIYRTGFERSEIGYASAASMVLMVILIVVAVIQLRFDKGSDQS